jgi:hypothetical protein
MKLIYRILQSLKKRWSYYQIAFSEHKNNINLLAVFASAIIAFLALVVTLSGLIININELKLQRDERAPYFQVKKIEFNEDHTELCYVISNTGNRPASNITNETIFWNFDSKVRLFANAHLSNDIGAMEASRYCSPTEFVFGGLGHSSTSESKIIMMISKIKGHDTKLGRELSETQKYYKLIFFEDKLQVLDATREEMKVLQSLENQWRCNN